ncbi:MAG: DNA-processing protein DprA [Gemmatimonadetes bacterium]|nr:DNA-processing protein DprA [Gemmatimonadota bacterium]
MTRDRLVRLGIAVSRLAPVTARKIRDHYGGWVAAVEAADRDRHFPESWRETFRAAERAGQGATERAGAARATVLWRGDPEWPEGLAGLTDPPEVLFVRGDPRLLREPSVAIVGTRECTPEGADLARRLGARLAEAGRCVVSGLARGIDTAAHVGALEGDGDTIAVLGAGVDVPTPPRNAALHEEIANRGALVSEFAPGTEPRPRHFPRRNRILAALAQAIVVIEARHRSGALVTARHGLDQGKEIFVVPGWPGSPLAAGPLALLRDGARPIRGADDLLEDLRGLGASPAFGIVAEGEDPPADSAEQRALRELLGPGARLE